MPISPMLGANVTISPENSPLLRRSGSRPIVPDLGLAEPGFALDEGFVSPIETIEMKTVNTPKHGASVMPSPAFFLRFKVILFFLWGFICCKVSVHSVMRMNASLRDLFLYEAFLYYNPLLLMALMMWLWGINLWVFSRSCVSYAKVFDLDHSHLTHKEIWKCATWITIFVPSSMTAYLYLYSHGEVLLYAAVLMAVIFPFDICYLSSRYYLLKTIWRILLPLQLLFMLWIIFGLSLGQFQLTFLLQAITFADFFIADILTSMSKVLSDLERSFCRMVHRQVATNAWFEADSVCGSHSVAIPLVLVLPYICRLFQCLGQYKDTKEKTTLLNALKYSTAVPVIFLSALKYHVFPESWTNFYRPLWLLSCVINSLYSFYWDVKRDWDLSILSKVFKFKASNLCSTLFYGRQWIYFWAIGSNLILRCTWTYKLSAHLRHNYLTVFAITALEIFRRFQWIFFRVENEWNRMTLKQSLQVSMTSIPKEHDQLLESTDHSV